MIKLYVFYFMFGLYMLFNSYTIWIFSEISLGFGGRGVNIITVVSFFSSAILFVICSGLSLYRIRLAIIIGIPALIAVFPFGLHWLIYRIQMESPIIKGTVNQIALLATLLYAIGLLYSIFLLNNNKRHLAVLKLNKRFRLGMTLLPVFLLVAFIILGYVNP
jgi:hypothetical protein